MNGGADVRAALDAITRMRAAGVEPDARTWKLVLTACANARSVFGGADCSEAWRVLRRMRDESGIEPDAVAWSIVINACAKAQLGQPGGGA